MWMATWYNITVKSWQLDAWMCSMHLDHKKLHNLLATQQQPSYHKETWFNHENYEQRRTQQFCHPTTIVDCPIHATHIPYTPAQPCQGRTYKPTHFQHGWTAHQRFHSHQPHNIPQGWDRAWLHLWHCHDQLSHPPVESQDYFPQLQHCHSRQQWQIVVQLAQAPTWCHGSFLLCYQYHPLFTMPPDVCFGLQPHQLGANPANRGTTSHGPLQWRYIPGKAQASLQQIMVGSQPWQTQATTFHSTTSRPAKSWSTTFQWMPQTDTPSFLCWWQHTRQRIWLILNKTGCYGKHWGNIHTPWGLRPFHLAGPSFVWWTRRHAHQLLILHPRSHCQHTMHGHWNKTGIHCQHIMLSPEAPWLPLQSFPITGY